MEISLFKNNLILPPEQLSHKGAPYWILPSSFPTTTMASQIDTLKIDPTTLDESIQQVIALLARRHNPTPVSSERVIEDDSLNFIAGTLIQPEISSVFLTFDWT